MVFVAFLGYFNQHKGETVSKNNVYFFKHSSRKNCYDMKLIAQGLHMMKSSGYSFQVIGNLCGGVFEKINN